MIKTHVFAYAVLGWTALACVEQAAAQEQPARIEARGQTTLGGSRESKSDFEEAPFTRSVVEVADSGANFSYFASSDIGLRALKVAARVVNTSGSPVAEFELGLVSSRADVRDILTFTSTQAADDVPIQVELRVTGELSDGFVSANSFLQLGLLGGTSVVDSALYDERGAIDDTLSVTQNVSFAEPNASVDMAFSSFLSVVVRAAEAGQTVFGDLTNTASFTLVLPDFVTLTASSSGTFGVPIPIPEPEVYAFMIAGLGLVGVMVGRRSRS